MKNSLTWSPRILGILFILFISLFALDIFGQGYTVWETIVGLFMHLIPSFLMVIALVLGWRNPALGAALFLLIGIAFYMWFDGVWLAAGPPLVIAALFAASAFTQRRATPAAG